jgi:transposase
MSKRYICPNIYFHQRMPQKAIIIVDFPRQPTDKCIVGPGLLSQLVIDKYVDHLPKYRQMQCFERASVKLSYFTIYALDQIQQLYIIERNCTPQQLLAADRDEIR